jgi:hypothetical protein
MPNDLTTMIARIAGELGSRFDLAGATGSTSPTTPNSEAIRNGINTAIAEYQKQRFRFSEINPSVPTTFNTVAGDSTYTTADSPVISSMYWIDYINLQVGNTLMELSRNTPEQQHLNIQMFNQMGLPTSYAYEGNTLILYPVPVAVYPVFIGGHIWIAGPATDSEANNPWMTVGQGELMIRSRAKYEIAIHVTRNPTMQLSMSPDPAENGQAYRAWKSLKAEGNKIMGTGKIRPMRW